MMPFVASSAFAQTPTPENTVISNTATASWTDANGNTYNPVTATASVTVGFSQGVDITGPTTGTPASPSTGNTVTFTINNIGNGTDSMTFVPTIPAGISVTGYRLNGGAVLTLAQLEVALSQLPIAQGGSATVQVIYDVASGRGGQTHNLVATSASRRNSAGAGTDAITDVLTPNVAAAVVVTPDAGTVSRLPSNGTQYTEQFTVQNNGNASDVISLVSSQTGGTFITIVSTNGTAGSSGTITLAAGASATVNVVYTVANNAAAAATSNLVLTATSGNNNTISDPGQFTITVIRSAITITKVAYRDNQSTLIGGADRVLPNEYIQYKITVTNTSTVAASSVQVTDPLNAQLTYDSNTPDAAGWSITTPGGVVTAQLTGGLAGGASRFFWVRAKVK